MSYWNGKDIVRWKPIPHESPGWWLTDCGCCNGIAWSAGTDANECSDCHGTGVRCIHAPSGTIALYPGGPLLGGHATADELASLRLEGSS